MLISPKKDCPHITNLFPINNFNIIPFHKLKCEDCFENKEILFCLICGKVYCNRYKNKHFLNHFIKNKTHCICLSLLDLSIWCYECKNSQFNFEGSYIENKIFSEYINIISSFKYGQNFYLNDKNLISNLYLDYSEISNIKYFNFIELLKNNYFKQGTIMVGAGISTSAGIPDFRSKSGIFNQIINKYKLKRPEEFFSKKLFIEKPLLFYEFLKTINFNKYLPTITHYFMRYLLDKNMINTIFTQNIDNLESKAGIPNENIIFAHGINFKGHCAVCDNNIDINIINNGIQTNNVVFCPLCNGPCKPRIVLYGEDLSKDFYAKKEELKNYDLGIIIGTSLNVEPFSGLPDCLNKNSWLIFMNNDEIGEYDYYNLTNNKIFIKGNCDELCEKLLKDCGWWEDFKNKFNDKLVIKKEES